MKKLTPEALRAARAILNWDLRKLAKETGLSFSSIAKIENGDVQPREKTEKAILDVLEKQNIEILNGGSPGARKIPK